MKRRAKGGANRQETPPGCTHPRDVNDIQAKWILNRARARNADGSFRYPYTAIAFNLRRAKPERRIRITPTGISALIRIRNPKLWEARRLAAGGEFYPQKRRCFLTPEQIEESRQRANAYWAKRRERLEALKESLGPMPEVPQN